MPRESVQGVTDQFGRMFTPMQQFGVMFIDGVERVTDFQLEMMQSYTHLAMRQMRDALEVHDAESLQRYFERQREAAEEFTQKMQEETRGLAEIGRSMSDRSIGIVRSGSEVAVETTQRLTEQARQAAERGTETAARMGREAAEAGRQAQQLAIKDYDELAASDIQNRIEKLNQDQVRQLMDHEKQNKNRKTLMEAFERRLQ